MKRSTLFSVIVLILAAFVALTAFGPKKDAPFARRLSQRLASVSTTIVRANVGSYFVGLQLVPVQADSVLSSRVEVKTSLSMDGSTFVLYKTFTDAITHGVCDTLWIADLPPCTAVKFQTTVIEADSVSVLPYLIEAR